MTNSEIGEWLNELEKALAIVQGDEVSDAAIVLAEMRTALDA